MPKMTAAEDEARLLATVGGTVTSMDTYESSVLRQATLDSAPKLTGIGFPSLAPMLPSYNAKTKQSEKSDLPHVRSVLSKTRSTIDQKVDDVSKETMVLRLKEQMLLSFLQEKLPPDEVPLLPIREASMEKKLSAKLKSDISTEQHVKQVNGGNENRTASKSQRLEQLKTDAPSITSASSTAAFGKQALLERKQRVSRKRLTMMERKSVGDEESKSDSETRELLRQRRKERQELKRQRRRKWVETNDSSSEEVELDNIVEGHGKDNDEEGAVMEDKATLESVEGSSAVTCPICEQSIQVESDTLDVDAALSRHINECQRRRRPRRITAVAKSNNTLEEQYSSAESGKRSAKKPPNKNRRARQRYAPSKPALDDMDEYDYEDRVDEWIESGIDSMRDMEERDESEAPPGAEEYNGGLIIPAWVNDKLFPYQRTGLRWMWELHTQDAGGIVGDEMGLGKTVQVCAFLGAMAACRKLNSVLIVAPATMLVHWLTELKTWAPGLRRVLIHKSGEADGFTRTISTTLIRRLEKWLRKSRADRVNEVIDDEDTEEFDDHRFCGTGYAIVTTYENIRRMPDIWTAHAWSYALLDEGQKIRNPDADVTLSCKRLRTPHRLLLSGTPIQNDLRELWSLFDFVFPGRLGTLPAFETEFSDPIKRGGYSNASPMQVQLAYRCALVLRDLINPYLLRRQKKDIDEINRMPGKTEQVLFCRLSDRQRALYEAYLRSEEVTSILKGSPQLFRSITVLRKICNHPDLVCDPDTSSFESFIRDGYAREEVLGDSSSDGDYEINEEEESVIERSGKLEVLAKILPLWWKQGHRVLIFCQWCRMLNIIEQFTRLNGWKFGRLDGNTNIASRQRLVDAFNNDKTYFGMLMTTRTGGVGLNLTGADRIILYDPDWNPQTDAQARERAWRFGQKNPVTVYRLITAGTIEEKIYQRQIFKTAISNRVLQDPRQRRLFSQRDLKDLFSLKADVGSVENGGHGFTETGEITKGGGVVDPDTENDPSPGDGSHRENTDTLETVMKSKGLAGVFDHDFVDDPASRKSASVREMEEQAKRVARDAAAALKGSTSGPTEFRPTWTGSSGAEPHRFGGNKRPRTVFQSKSKPRATDADNGFGGARVAGVAFASGHENSSSGDLLAQLRNKSRQVTGAASSAGSSQLVSSGDTRKYADLMNSLRKFIMHHGRFGPTTDEILKEFDSIPNRDAAIFRRLLNSIARVEGGRWRLKELN